MCVSVCVYIYVYLLYIIVCVCLFSSGSRHSGRKYSEYPRDRHVSPAGEFIHLSIVDHLKLRFRRVGAGDSDFSASAGLLCAGILLRSLFGPIRMRCGGLEPPPPPSLGHCGSPGSDPAHLHHRCCSLSLTHSLLSFVNPMLLSHLCVLPVCAEEVCMDQDNSGSEEELTCQLYSTLRKHLGR